MEVNVAGEESKGGIGPAELGDFIERCPVRVAGLMTMPPFSTDPEASRPALRPPRRAGRRARARAALDGHQPGLGGGGRGGSDDPAAGHGALRVGKGGRGSSSGRHSVCPSRHNPYRKSLPRSERTLSDGLPRHMAPCARLLRARRGPRVPGAGPVRARHRDPGRVLRGARAARRDGQPAPRASPRPRRDRRHLRRRRAGGRRAHAHAAAGGRQRRRRRARPPGDAVQLQRRPGGRRQVQAGTSR